MEINEQKLEKILKGQKVKTDRERVSVRSGD